MRALLAAALALALAAPAAARDDAPEPPALISAPDAHARAAAGKLLLIDVRPLEAGAGGVPEHAERVDALDPMFVDLVDMLAEGDKSRQIALICFTGGRSEAAARQLMAAGYTRAMDVAEGVSGSDAGPGWIARGLPLVQP